MSCLKGSLSTGIKDRRLETGAKFYHPVWVRSDTNCMHADGFCGHELRLVNLELKHSHGLKKQNKPSSDKAILKKFVLIYLSLIVYFIITSQKFRTLPKVCSLSCLNY